MSLPRAVEVQGARAEELIQARAAARSGNTAPAAPKQPEVASSQVAPATPATPATPPTPAEPHADVAALEQRFRVLEGKYKNEVPRALAAAKAEKERADRLEAELAESRKVAAAKPLVTEDEMKEFGEPLVGLQRRIAEEVTRPLLAQIEELKRSNGELGAQVKSTAQVGQSLNTQAFFTALDAKVPDWKAINEDKQFLAWLDGIDPLYGKPRQEILDEAQNSLDANRVGAFFVAYKADVQSRAAPRTEALESQITPSTTTGAPVNQNVPEKKIWTPATISKFYDDVRRGRISTEEAARIELDIHAAQREGRYKTR